MDLRDQIAVEVMKSELSKFNLEGDEDATKSLAEFSYQVADAMLDERCRSMN